MTKMSLPRVALATLVAGFCLPSETALAQGQPTATIIFDGSGSIWGRLDGTKAAKLDVARDAIKALLGRGTGSSAVGLASYGHRRRGDCSDVEIIVPPEAGAGERVGTALDKLNPRGKGPISLAVREVAREIGSRRPASIVLVTDNADNCRPDFCELGEELAKSQPGLAVHIVGIGLEPDEIPKTQCVAKATGGRFTDSRNADQVTAHLTEVLTLALRAGQPPPAAEAAAEPKLQTPPQRAQRNPPPAGKPAVAAVAVLGGDGGADITTPLRWRVLSADGAATVLSSTGPSLDVPLAAGKYVVEAEANGIAARREVEVPVGGPANLRVALPAGLLEITSAGLKLSSAPVLITVSPDTVGPAPLLVSSDPEAGLLLAPGTYRLRAEQGHAWAESRVTIEAGKVAKADLGLAAARIELSAAATGDGPALDGATFIIAAEEASGAWREVARSAAQTPSFIVQAGNYRVTARLGEAQAHQRIVVVAGETAKRTLLLSLSRLKLSATLPASTSAAPVTFKVTSLDGDAGEPVLASAARPELALPAGRYKVEAQAGAQNVHGETTVSLAAGRDSQQELKLAAAAVTLRASGAAPAQSDIYWEVREAGSGRVVWRSAHPEPRGLLAPGRYSVRMESRDRRLEKIFDLAAGEARTIEVGI